LDLNFKLGSKKQRNEIRTISKNPELQCDLNHNTIKNAKESQNTTLGTEKYEFRVVFCLW
jgi:hypothetical protein